MQTLPALATLLGLVALALAPQSAAGPVLDQAWIGRGAVSFDYDSTCCPGYDYVCHDQPVSVSVRRSPWSAYSGNSQDWIFEFKRIDVQSGTLPDATCKGPLSWSWGLTGSPESGFHIMTANSDCLERAWDVAPFDAATQVLFSESKCGTKGYTFALSAVIDFT